MKKIALVLLLLALCAVLTGCSAVGYVYSNAEEYEIGGATINRRVDDLDIDWLDGCVTVAYHDGDSIVIKEETHASLDRDVEMHWLLDGKTLKIKYAASGVHHLPNLDKQLTVLLPHGLKLDDVEIQVASSEVQADGLDAEEIRIATASGRVALRQCGEADDIKVSTASGGIAVAAEAADLVDLDTVSGVVIVNGQAIDELKVNTVSGNVTLQFSKAPYNVDVGAVSGDVTLRLPQDDGFLAKVESLSGDVGCSLPAKSEDGKAFQYGNSHCRIKVNTVSGDVLLENNNVAGDISI